jgi:hypothetical protein
MENLDVAVNASPEMKTGQEVEFTGFEDIDQIVGDAVAHIFVKVSFVAEALKIEFQAFQFNADFVGNVLESDLCIIGLSRFGAKAGKFRAKMRDEIVSLGMGIGENFHVFDIITFVKLRPREKS